MKNLLYYSLIMGCMIILVSSCSTTTRFTVSGEPGTEILTPNKERLATITKSGVATITNPDDDYYAFLISHKPGTDDYVPFALDYKQKSYPGSRTSEMIGLMITLGAGVTCIATALSGANSIAAATGGLMLVGASIGTSGSFRSNQTNHEYSYKYLPTQRTNQDITMTKPVLEYVKVDSTPERTNVKSTEEPVSTVSTKTLASSSTTKTLKDNAARIEGVYVGDGTLKQGNEVIEEYSGIKVVLKRQSKDTVLVNVIESNGSKYFGSDGEYSIRKTSDGIYSLSLKGIKNATIEIDTQSNLIYIHPRVNIDNEIYTLSIKGKKE